MRLLKSNASKSFENENEHEAKASWEMGKDLGLSTSFDVVAMQAIIEELVERKGKRRGKEGRGARKANNVEGDLEPGDVMTPS